MATERTNFENLRVYRLAEDLSDRLWIIAMSWSWFARKTVGSQLIRAADSIGANIAEGTGRGTYNDNRRFLYIARGSLNETKHWLRRAYQRDLLRKEEVMELKNVMDQLAPMLNAYLNSMTRMARINRTDSTNH